MPIPPNTTDLGDACAPEDVVAILRNAAQKFYESQGELQAVWQDKNAGKEWANIARKIIKLSNSL